MIIDTQKIRELIGINRACGVEESSIVELERALSMIEFVNTRIEDENKTVFAGGNYANLNCRN